MKDTINKSLCLIVLLLAACGEAPRKDTESGSLSRSSVQLAPDTGWRYTDSIPTAYRMTDSLVTVSYTDSLPSRWRMTDSSYTAPPVVIDSFPRPLPIDVADPFKLTATCQKRAIHVQRWYNRDGNPLDLCAGEYAPIKTPPPVDTTPTDTIPTDTVVTPPVDSIIAPPIGNRPGGLTHVATHTCTSLIESGFTNRNNTARIVPDGRGSVCEATFRQGMRGGTGPVQVDHPVKGTTLYIAFDLYLSPHWQGHSSGVNKVLHIWIDGVNRLYLSAQGSGGRPLEAQLRLQRVAEQPISRNLRGSQSIPRGRWVRWEVVAKANTSGQANGSVQWWIDGKPAGSVSNIRWTAGTPRWERVSWAPTWGGVGDNVRVAQVMRLDDLTIYGQ